HEGPQRRGAGAFRRDPARHFNTTAGHARGNDGRSRCWRSAANAGIAWIRSTKRSARNPGSAYSTKATAHQWRYSGMKSLEIRLEVKAAHHEKNNSSILLTNNYT